jgi:hypothetical protein
MPKEPKLTEVEWRGHVDSWQISGLRQAEYCRNHSLDKANFSYWKRRHADQPRVQVRISGEGDRTTQAALTPLPLALSPLETSSQARPQPIFPSARPRQALSFWVGRFCVEVRDGFSRASLSRLVRVLEALA